MRCILCDSELTQIEPVRFEHPESEVCLVKFTDQFGIAINAEIIEVEEDPNEPNELEQQFPTVESILKEIFANQGLDRLGGVSSGRGWSSVSTWQRCRYLWKQKYLVGFDRTSSTLGLAIEHKALAIGTIIHTLLAIYYQRMITPDYPLTVEIVRDRLLAKCNPEFINEGWRVFLNYTLYYQNEEIWPIAVEYDLKDPRNGDSCRYDLIAFFPSATNERPAGSYIVEHKSSGRFDDATLNGWANDGEVLGQIMLWDRLKLNHRFGTLQGVIVNILGKQREPQFHRTWVPPSTWQSNQHSRDLRHCEAEIALAKASDTFPRSRANCIGRYGRCDLWDHCVSDDNS